MCLSIMSLLDCLMWRPLCGVLAERFLKASFIINILKVALSICIFGWKTFQG